MKKKILYEVIWVQEKLWCLYITVPCKTRKEAENTRKIYKCVEKGFKEGAK
jgi:hypothetical protein